MPSISHRASLGQATPHRAESGSTALPAGCIGGLTRRATREIAGRLAGWRENWRALRRIGAPSTHLPTDHLLRDIGLADARDLNISHRERQDPKGRQTWPTIF